MGRYEVILFRSLATFLDMRLVYCDITLGAAGGFIGRQPVISPLLPGRGSSLVITGLRHCSKAFYAAISLRLARGS